MNRARQQAYLTGMNGSYSTDVTGQSEFHNTNNSNTYSSYADSYRGGINGSVVLGQPDYLNPKNLLHNNVGDRVLAEQVFENRVFIDSVFRDHSKYPDPFKFVVKFNGTDPRIENVYVEIDGETYSYPKYIDGDSTVVFDRIFKNIKAVIINTLFMPFCIEFKTNEDGSYDKAGMKLEKLYYKYIVLKINELCNGRSFSNNKLIGQESFIMRIDDEVCKNHHRWVPISSHISYPDSKLRLLDRLSIEVCTDKGERLCPKLDGNPHDFYAEYRTLIDKIKILQRQKCYNEIEKLKPKLDSLKLITSFLSPELHLTFCTLDTQIQTLPQY